MEEGYCLQFVPKHLPAFQLPLVNTKWSQILIPSYMLPGSTLDILQGCQRTMLNRVYQLQSKGHPIPLYIQRMSLWIPGFGINSTWIFTPQCVFALRILISLLC